MSRPVFTYAKREVKKLLPLFVIAVLYIGFTFGYVYLEDKNFVGNALLMASYPELYTMEVGDLFMRSLLNVMNQLSPFFDVFFTVILVSRLFRTENQAEISDFLRTLPVKEWKKLWIKTAAGEALIALTCVLFGAAGTITNAILSPGIQQVNNLVVNETWQSHSYAFLWQTVLLMFLGMSAVFLVFFAAQSCIHHMGAALFVGGGVLLTPAYLATAFYNYDVPEYGWGWRPQEIAYSLAFHYPSQQYGSEFQFTADSWADVVQTYWVYYPQKLIFLGIVITAALAVIVTASILRWNIRESSHQAVNSDAVLEFILTGVSLLVASFLVMISYDEELFGFLMYSLCLGAVFLGLANVVLYVVRKKRKGV